MEFKKPGTPPGEVEAMSFLHKRSATNTTFVKAYVVLDLFSLTMNIFLERRQVQVLMCQILYQLFDVRINAEMAGWEARVLPLCSVLCCPAIKALFKCCFSS